VPSVRIIAGERKGHRLKVPRGEAVRPTSDRVREAVFAALAAAGVLGAVDDRCPVPGASSAAPTDALSGVLERADGGVEVLDLFAGTGALGLEALSRGAGHAVFVETDPRVAAVLTANIRGVSYEARARVMAVDFTRALRVLRREGGRFDLLFVDPPYRMLPDVGRVLSPVIAALLAPGGLVVIEGPRSVRVDLGLGIVFERRYGDTVVTMVKEEAETA
jgi:16S rRNA (guanine966-N2)-methyltransferase